MSNNQDNLENKLSDAKAIAGGMLSKDKHISAVNTSAVEVAKTGSIKDVILWLLAAAVLIGATLVNQYLPGYWQPANDLWVRIGIIVALFVFALLCLALTNQGRAFKTLLKDAAVELRRVTWPGKDETFQYTWQTIVMIAIVGFIVWLLDNFFTWFVGIFIG
ncbi:MULTISPECIES: preprotein translocase subunit SecE [unclassified Psychrobacter]|uniref:preprotein translocase subunit SecE n=1 Tax=unclassified Psychrobacter TaxID=196806 RepID=UPI0009A6F327|nr:MULTISPECIES: preprotein translocase subunit SecE [unclassified Psychrobacter]MDE4455927.1 preprotein translocase subunit SecE [Psychrobacter sp. DAB_AL62B]OXL25757.1 preprotein translocase subunit SecE [Psychrobacter sp. DAB_AL32B]SLJ85673.1 preprotein translocase subunit SecE [Psychrobacter sp. DAB_AL43B]